MAFSTETNYIKFHDTRPTVTHLSIQRINIIALKKAVLKIGDMTLKIVNNVNVSYIIFSGKQEKIKFLTKVYEFVKNKKI